MKNNLFYYWDYDSIDCKPRVQFTVLGCAIMVILFAVIAYVLVWVGALCVNVWTF